jgi:uncharacterized membrane protein (UPF0127 family)
MKILLIAMMSMMFFTAGYAADAKTEKLTVVSKDGTEHYFNVEIAATPVDREVGLMFRTSMDPDHGMLFEMEANATVEFWMKDTLIPLDMLFVASDGTIKTIHENAIPKDLTPLSSNVPVTGVIELNGGRASALGIAVGDKVVFPFFGGGKK